MAALVLAAALAGLVLLAAACADADSPDAPPDVPTFEGAIDLEIGEMDGDDPYLFTYIGSIVEDARGRLVVADRRTNEIRVFEPDGRFAFRFGGHGEGPGELNDPCCLEFDPDGALWVRESTRYSVFRLDSAGAEYERGRPTLHPGQAGIQDPFTFDPEGRLVNVGPVRAEEGTSITAQLRSVAARLHVNADGAVDTVILADAERQFTGQTTTEFERGGFSGIGFLHHPHGPTWIHAHAAGGAWAEAVTSDYVVNYHRPDGTVLQIEGPESPGPALSPEEQAWAQERIDRELDRFDLDGHPFGIPDRKPPLADIFFDRAGRLWIEKTAADGAEMREADVWAGTELVARYRWPRKIQEWPSPWVADSILYGVTADSLGVQRVARVRFRPATPP
jgi:hypothetical protein